MILKIYKYRRRGRVVLCRKWLKGAGQNPPKGGTRAWAAGRRKGQLGHCGYCGEPGHNIRSHKDAA